MKKLTAILLALCLLALSGCGGYASKYYAFGLVKSNTAEAASLHFKRMGGSMVFHLSCTDPAQQIRYTATLESGSATVYYDCGEGKTELCALDAGETLDASGGTLEEGMVVLIVELSGSCKNGDFQFSLGS